MGFLVRGDFFLGGGTPKQWPTALYAMADWCLISKEIKQKVETSDGKLVLKHTER